MMTGFSAPGERQTGRRDIDSEAKLPLVQGLIRAGIDLVTFLMALVMYFCIGGYGAATVAAAITLVFKARVGSWIENRVMALENITLLDWALRIEWERLISSARMN